MDYKFENQKVLKVFVNGKQLSNKMWSIWDGSLCINEEVKMKKRNNMIITHSTIDKVKR